MTLEPVRVAPWNPLAIIAFVLAFVVPPGAIVCGHIALGQLRTSGEQGYPFALAGTIMGWVFTAMIALVFVVWLVVLVGFIGVFGTVVTQVPRSL